MKISILIVSRNNSSTIEKSIFSALNQKLPSGLDLEVLVLDDGSDDGQKELLKKIENKSYKNLKIFFNQKRLGIGKGRNFLVNKSKGDYLFFLDGDGKASSDWIINTLPLFKEEDVGIVTSLVLFEKRKDLVNGLGGRVNLSFFGIDNFFCEYIYFIPSSSFYTLFGMNNGLVIKREIFQIIDFFNEDEYSYEDFDICTKAWINGFKVVANPRGIIYHNTTSFIKHTLRRKFFDTYCRLKFFLFYAPFSFNYIFQFFKNELLFFKKTDIGFKILYIKAFLKLIKNFPLIIKKRINFKDKENRYFIYKKLDNFFGSYLVSLVDFRSDKLYNLGSSLEMNNPFNYFEKIGYDEKNKKFILKSSGKIRFFKSYNHKKLILESDKEIDFIKIILKSYKDNKFWEQTFFNQYKNIVIFLPPEIKDLAGYIDIYIKTIKPLYIKTLRLE